MASYDLTVMGAGIFGLSCAWAAVNRGVKVQLIDPYGLAAGASGGVVGALAPHVPETWNPKKAFQLEALLMQEAFWAEVEALGGQSAGYARSGRLQPLLDENAVAHARARASGAEALWGENARWEVIAAPDTPWGVTSPTGLFIHDTLTARIAPKRACAALLAALKARGVTLQGEGKLEGSVIWATGYAGLQALSQDLGRLAGGGVKGQAAVFKADLAQEPQIFVDTVHVIAHADGTVAIGSTSENAWESATDTDAQLDDLIAKVRASVPALREAEVIGRWAGIRPRAKSRAPLLAAHPQAPGHFIANGGFKIGFGVAPLVGEVMADLVLEGHDRIPQGFGF